MGKPLALHNNGEDRIDFTYVKDTAHGFVLAAMSDQAKNETFNITRGEWRSIKEFVDVLKEIFPNVEVEPRPPDERRPNRGALDIAKARKILGYQPQYDIKKGIREYVDFVLGYGALNKE